MSPVSHIDTSGLHILHDMLRIYKERGVKLCFSNPNVSVMERFRTSGFAAEVGDEWFFDTIHDAITWCLNELDAEATEDSDQDMQPVVSDLEEGETENDIRA